MGRNELAVDVHAHLLTKVLMPQFRTEHCFFALMAMLETCMKSQTNLTKVCVLQCNEKLFTEHTILYAV